MAIESSFNRGAWSGASGMQIGYATDYPVTQPQGFTADEVHSQAYDPNAPNLAAQRGPKDGFDVPVLIQDDPALLQNEGADGWILDDIGMPVHGAPAGTMGHAPYMDGARSPRRDPAHGDDIYQLNQPPGYARDFYGRTIQSTESGAWTGWRSSSAPNFNNKSYPADAREITTAWPEPFAVQDVAGFRPVVLPNERIPMRRIGEDDRPLYQYLATPARNISAGGTQWLPTVESNTTLRTIIPTPQMPRTPEDPWISLQTQQDTYQTSTDIGTGWV